MSKCFHIAQTTEAWPWIGLRYTDGTRVVCGGCLPRDAKGHVMPEWKQRRS